MLWIMRGHSLLLKNFQQSLFLTFDGKKQWIFIGIAIILMVLLVLQTVLFKIPIDLVSLQPQKNFLLSSDSTGTFQKVPGLQELSGLLKKRLEMTSSSEKMIYSELCDGRKMTGCSDPHCKRPLSSDPVERLRDIIGNPNLTLSNATRELILSIGSSIPENDIIIVSASSSNHYDEMQAMFENLHSVVYPLLTNFSVVIFDIGLTKEQRDMTEKKCKCQVLSFPTEKFPEHVKDNHCYSWKPIVIRAVIERARDLVLWQDASIRWTNHVTTYINSARRHGHQVIRYKYSPRVTAHTLKQTFDYMGEEPCTFFPYPEIQTGLTLHKKDPLTIGAVLDPWTRCALEKSCMCPVTPSSVNSCNGNKPIHRCHRFDQSALTLILAKLYGKNMYRILSPQDSFMAPKGITVRRGYRKPTYFKDLQI